MAHPERWVAALMALACIFMLIRLVLGRQRRDSLDSAVLRATQASRDAGMRLKALITHRQARRDAEKVATEAIDRARQRSFEKDGNILRPKAFQKPAKPQRENGDKAG